MNALIYARFSPRPAADECDSVEKQIIRCKAYCKANDYRILVIYGDKDMSGGRADNRPGLQEALRVACRMKAVVVTYDLTRLARSVGDADAILKRLRKAGGNWASVRDQIDTSTPMGRFVFAMFSAIAQWQREETADRTSKAMQHHQKNGRRMSDRLPYGFRLHPEDRAHMIPDPDEQRIIERICNLHSTGHRLREIGRVLEETGDLCRGKTWYHTTIKRILQKEGAL